MGRATFQFRLNGWQTRPSDRELRAGLRRFGLIAGKGFTQKAWDAWGKKPCWAVTIRARLGGWESALVSVGMGGSKRWGYSASECVERLEAAWRKHGRAPGAKTIRAWAGISSGPYVRDWGG